MVWKKRWSLAISLLSNFQLSAQNTLVVNQWKGEQVFAHAYSPRQVFRFSGKYFQDVYGTVTDSLGLLFDRGGKQVFEGSILLRPQKSNQQFEETWHDSPVLSVRNKTDLYFSGYWQGDNNYCKPILNILDSGRFVFGKDSRFKLVFPAYGNFTRQLWVRSDGTGVLEVEDGFIADRSEGGKVCDGTGCFRLKDCTFRSHHEASLPVYFRPEKTNPAVSRINSHLVFEKGKRGRWEVLSRPQHFVGGLWLYNDTEVFTDKHLTLSGQYTHWSDYTNYGGLIYAEKGVTLFKTGSDTLTLSGHTCLPEGSKMVVKSGVVKLKTNPWYSAADTVKGLSKIPLLNGKNLELELEPGAELLIHTPLVEVKSLKVLPGARISVLGKTKVLCERVEGKLEVWVEQSVHDFQIETDSGKRPKITCFTQKKRP